MAKTKQQPPIVVDNGTNDMSITFYVSDEASGHVPRLIVTMLRNGVPVISYDHAVSEYSSLTSNQKQNLRTMLTALRDETFTLEGFT